MKGSCLHPLANYPSPTGHMRSRCSRNCNSSPCRCRCNRRRHPWCHQHCPNVDMISRCRCYRRKTRRRVASSSALSKDLPSTVGCRSEGDRERGQEKEREETSGTCTATAVTAVNRFKVVALVVTHAIQSTTKIVPVLTWVINAVGIGAGRRAESCAYTGKMEVREGGGDHAHTRELNFTRIQ